MSAALEERPDGLKERSFGPLGEPLQGLKGKADRSQLPAILVIEAFSHRLFA